MREGERERQMNAVMIRAAMPARRNKERERETNGVGNLVRQIKNDSIKCSGLAYHLGNLWSRDQLVPHVLAVFRRAREGAKVRCVCVCFREREGDGYSNETLCWNIPPALPLSLT